MGEFDCYCILCSGPLVPIEIGSKKRGWLNKRRRRLRQKLHARERGHSFDSFESGSEHESDRDSDQIQDPDRDPDEEVYFDEERRSYDPDVVTEERIRWVREVRVLGWHCGRKAFISGPATYDDAGLIYVEMGEDPNQPPVSEKPYFDCYVPSNENDVVFPFHPRCMTVLENAHQWCRSRSKSSEERLDLEVLYKTAVRIGRPETLNLDYGGIRGVDQCWESIPGEEGKYAVIDPLEFPLDTIDMHSKSTVEQNALPLRNRATVDPFQGLPVQIVHLICGYLPGSALQAFLTASGTAYLATLDPAFWKSLCVSRLLWAWELWEDSDLARQDAPAKSKLDWKRAYLCLEINTAKRGGLTIEMSRWMGITNRRRIWDACVQLLEHYRREVRDMA